MKIKDLLNPWYSLDDPFWPTFAKITVGATLFGAGMASLVALCVWLNGVFPK